MEIKNGKCSVCGKPFTDQDDVVVCPECGAPYHRACYEKEGKCVFSARHGTGFSYHEPVRANTVRCPNCGADNDLSALFCTNCGTPIKEPESYGQAAPPPPMYDDPLSGARMDGPYAAVPPMPASFDGIPTNEWAQYIGNSAQYYLFQFQRMDHLHRRTSFCWSALFVPPAYFLYRRMWGWGILATVLTVLLSVPGMLLMAADANVVLPVSTSLLETLSMVAFYLNWALSFVCGLYAFWLYRRHASRKLLRMREQAGGEEEYRAALARSSGPSAVAVGVLIAFLILLGFAFLQWVGLDALYASSVFMI